MILWKTPDGVSLDTLAEEVVPAHLGDLDIEGAALEFVSLCDLRVTPERAVKAIVAVAMRNHVAVRREE